jgi:hypothetical protein
MCKILLQGQMLSMGGIILDENKGVVPQLNIAKL